MTLNKHHAYVAALARHRPPNDPDLISARTTLGEETLVVSVARALDKAPPLTATVRQRLDALLASHDQAA